MNLKEINSVYFIGIGGIGMSALARYFKFVQKNVAGYDKTETPLTKTLTALDIDVHYTDDIAVVPKMFLNPETTLVVYTPAVSQDHGELTYFTKQGFEVKKRSEVLGIITNDTFCFAVAGTHGKTTTSSILAHLLKETKTPLIAFLGGISEDFNSNFLLEGTEYSVVEADEFDRSFLQLSPNVACITSMDADHLDIYGDHATLKTSFQDFIERIEPDGKLFVRNGLPLKGITYGIADDADYCIENLKVSNGSYVFDIRTPKGLFKNAKFHKPGLHNLLNSLVAFAMALETKVSGEVLLEALETFKGVQRRFSYVLKKEDFIFIDDYAHHPTEIDAVFEAVSTMHPDKRTLAVFQPHLYSRTRDFGEDFANSLSKFEGLLLLDIYPARETPLPGINSKWLLEKVANSDKKIVKKSNLIAEIKAWNPEVLITMGAGDIGQEVSKIKKELAYES